MQAGDRQPGRVRRAVDELVMAEMFLVQATIESASAIGDGLSELREALTAENSDTRKALDLLQRTADEAVEPYTTRFRYLKQLRDADR